MNSHASQAGRPERWMIAQIGHRLRAADRRHRALVEVAERLARSARRLSRDAARDVAALRHGHRRDAGQQRAVLLDVHHVADARRSPDGRAGSDPAARGCGRSDRSPRRSRAPAAPPAATPARRPPTAPCAPRCALRARRSAPRRRRRRPAATAVPSRTVTPSRSSWRLAFADRLGGYGGRTRSAASSRMISASAGWMARKSLRSVSLAISPSAPASSTPVGPAPTTTNVSQGCRRPASVSRSAISKASRMRERISVASSMVLSPGANALPVVVAEVVMGRARGDHQHVVVERAVAQQRRAGSATSMSTTSPSSTRVLRCLLQHVAQRRGDLARRQAARSRPGTAAAGRGESCAGRRRSARTGARRSACAA